MKYQFMTVLCAMTLLAGCSHHNYNLGKEDTESLPKVEPEQVEIYSHALVPQNCKQISIWITEAKNDLKSIMDDLRKQAGELGGNYVNIETLSYKGEGNDKYATATIYSCANNNASVEND